MQQALDIALKDEDIRHPAQKTERRGVVENIPHGGDTLIPGEKMIVIEPLKCASYHRVSKMAGAFEDRYAAGQPLAYPQVDRLPRHLFIQANQSCRYTTHHLLVGLGC